MEDLIIHVDGKEYRVKVEETKEGKILVHCGNDVYEVEAKADIKNALAETEKKSRKSKAKEGAIIAPLPGTIFSVEVKKGDRVKEGQTLVKLMAMKMENEVIAQRDGIVKEISVKKFDAVNKGDILVIIE